MWKRVLCVLLSLLMMAGAVTAWADGSWYISGPKGETVNVRSGPAQDYNVITQLKNGTAVEYVETENGWCLIAYKGIRGYVNASFLAQASEEKSTESAQGAGSETAAQASYTAYITSSNGKAVNLRAGAGTGFDVVATAEVGTQVTVLEKGKTWSKISANGTTCYVMSKLLTTTRPVAPAQANGNTEETQQTESAYIVSDNGGAVRVRKGAGTAYSVIGTLAYGSEITVIGTQGTWKHVRAGELDGFVMARYVSLEKPKAIEPAAEPTPASETYEGIRYVVSANGKNVNVRKTGSSAGKTIGSLEFGTQVTLVKEGKTWSRILSELGEGYIMTRYLSESKPEPYETAEPSFKSYTAYVYSTNGKGVNVRKGAGSRYNSVANLDVGTEVTVIGETGSWNKITTGAVTGYIMKTYLSETKPAVETETAVSPSWVPSAGSRVYIASAKNKIVRTYSSIGARKADGKAYPAGTPCTVISASDGWAKIKVAGIETYLPFANLSSNGAAAIPESANRLVYYLAGDESMVTVRRAKQAMSDSLGSFLRGTAVIVMSRNTDEGWAYIQVGTTKGYVDLKQLSSK